MLTKIISGGQTGADKGALMAAKFMGIPTGGWMPKGFWTERGARPEYAKEYGMTECGASGYKLRTSLNVRFSDGTLIFAGKLNSAGTRMTEYLARWHGLPLESMDVGVGDGMSVEQAVRWIKSNGVRTLNVAGNRESVCPGIEKKTYEIMCRLIQELESDAIKG
jgi:hypothetical protein